MKNSKKPKKGRFGRWAAHHFRFCLLWVPLMPIPIYITNINKTPGTDTWVVTSIPEFVLFVAVATWGASCLLMMLMLMGALGHFSNPCVDCATSFPLNAAEQAKKWQPMFDMHHKVGRSGQAVMRRVGDRPLVALLVMLGLVVSFFIVFFVTVDALVPEPWTAPVGIALILIPLAIFLSPARKHFHLAPWCESCDGEGWGDGGPKEPSPEIPPLPTTTKTI